MKTLMSTFGSKFPAKQLYAFLENYRIMNNLSRKELSEKLGWKPQYYGQLNRTEKVFTRTVMTVAAKLGIDPDEIAYIVTEREKAMIEIIKEYPSEVIIWIASDEGKKTIIREYTKRIIEKAKLELQEKTKGVLDLMMSAGTRKDEDAEEENRVQAIRDAYGVRETT